MHLHETDGWLRTTFLAEPRATRTPASIPLHLAKEAEFQVAHATAVAAGVPARRSARAATSAATAAIDAARQRERAPLPTDACEVTFLIVLCFAHLDGPSAHGVIFSKCILRT